MGIRDIFSINGSDKKKRWIKALWFLALALVIGAFLLFYLLSKNGIPSFEELENPKYNEASIIFDTHGVQYGKYYVENREPIPFEELNPLIHSALIATEDARFYDHSGVDLQALFRVAFKTVLMRQKSQGGGSTITQQLAKQLFSRPSMRGMGAIKRATTLVSAKLREWITAVRLESAYTKEEIIMMYLNKFEFINGAHGIQAASQTYFGKNQDQLTVDEAAVLVGMLQNPSLYNPRRFPEKAKERRNTVLALLQANDVIDQAEHDSLIVKGVDMSAFERRQQSDGPAPYFRSELTKWVKKILKESDIRKSDGTEYNIYTDGLKIYTTIDLTYQKYAEEASAEHMQWLQERFFNVWKRRNPWTYEADDIQREIRKDIFSSRMKASERYLAIRKRNLGKILAVVEKEYGDIPTSDNVISTLQDIHNKKMSISGAIEQGDLKQEYKADYQRLLRSKTWQELKSIYSDHVKDFEREFDTVVKMKIFDHKEGEKEVEMSPRDSVKHHNMHLQNGVLAVDPITGHIKAWVGGINHKYFKYDHVTSRRSVGSTIKPFVYTSAMAFGGISPCQTFDDIQYTIAPGDANFMVDKEWSPANANGEFTGNKYNLYHGLLYSKNSITVRLVKELGNVQVIRDLLDNVGIDKHETLTNGRLAVPNLPSMCLGAVDLTLQDMAGAYTAFANKGMYTEPIFVTKIEDKNGRVLYTGVPKRKTAINPLYNSVILDMLQNNTGGKYGMGIKTPNGGKTGTTNDYSDGWFMGVTPRLILGTWTGGDDKWIRFLSLENGQGYVMARPVFQKFFKKLEKDTTGVYDPNVKFPEAPYGFEDLVDCTKYKQVDPEEEQQQLMEEKLQSDEFDDEFDDDFGDEEDGEKMPLPPTEDQDEEDEDFDGLP